MKTIDEFLKIIREDQEVQKLICESTEIKRDYKPRTRRGRAKIISTKSGIALSHFWDSIDGAKFRLLLEKKYGVDIGNTQLIGKLKTALGIYFWEVIGE